MRKTTILLFLATCFSLFSACGETNSTDSDNGETDSSAVVNEPEAETYNPENDTLKYPEETHLRNVRQLTFGGNNAEAYFSRDNKHLVFQSDYKEWGVECDQIFTMPITGHGAEKPKMLSTGKGRTTCSYFMAGDQKIVYASTHLGGEACPAEPERKPGGLYVWSVYDTYDIFVADMEGNIVEQLTNEPGYDAEATLSPDGSKIVFTSTRSGDLELWTMNADGSDLTQITDELGYDGGAFYSPDGSKLVWRSSRPKTEEDQKLYKDLLAKGQVQPTDLELYISNADGSDKKRVTNLGGANWAPFFHPSGEKLIFASNHKGESGRTFNLFTVNLDGSGLEQITHDSIFDAFPMFSYDGKYLVFSSNRFNGGTRDTNVFLAEWVD